MKRKCKKYLVMVLMLCTVLLFGCDNKGKDSDSKEEISEKVENELGISEDSPKVSGGPVLTLPVAETKEIFIYAIDSDTIEKQAVTALVPSDSEITPELIVDMVVDAMADESILIGIDSVITKDDTVIVSFKDNQPPVVNVGASAEGEILDAFAQSLLDNLTDYNKVVFQIMGKAYVTGHFEFDLNYVYMEKSN